MSVRFSWTNRKILSARQRRWQHVAYALFPSRQRNSGQSSSRHCRCADPDFLILHHSTPSGGRTDAIAASECSSVSGSGGGLAKTRCATWMTTFLAMGRWSTKFWPLTQVHAWWCSVKIRSAFYYEPKRTEHVQTRRGSADPGPANRRTGNDQRADTASTWRSEWPSCAATRCTIQAS